MDMKALREEMDSQKMSVEDLAKKTGIERSALYRRFKSEGTKFTVSEAKRIADALALERTVAATIFLD